MRIMTDKHTSALTLRGPARVPRRRHRGLLLRALDLLLTWQERANERRHLQQLDERMLRDLGLSRADVTSEASKPFWLV